ncbi:MAG: DUF1549 domain-containing protein [Planctomycetaceae bacterium]
MFLLMACLWPVWSVCAAEGDRPLWERVDALILAKSDGELAARGTDAEFLRRVTLDLAGRIPTTDEVRDFLADAADKRVRKIDRLLASPEYAARMRDVWHVVLMERLGDHPEWLSFLEQAFRENRPWDQTVRQILDPQESDESLRGAAFFWTKRLENYGQNPVDYPALTRDVGRLFLGVDLQCAQCHDHLFVDTYHQADFQGLSAFVAQTFLRTDVKYPAVGEKPVGSKIEFTSVFTKVSGSTGPRLPGGMEVEVPSLVKGEEFEVPPDKATKFPGRPKFRPLEILAKQVTANEQTNFDRNAVNRIWFSLMGRGLVHPLDLHHPDNPPSHPELLELLTKEFAGHGRDVRWLIRELMLSETYQRSGRWAGARVQSGGKVPAESSYRVAIERPLSSEQLLASVVLATGEPELSLLVLSPRDKESKAYTQELERFRKAFSNIARDPEIEFRPSVKGALFLMHDAEVLTWFQPSRSQTVSRLVPLSDEQLADELYLTVLSRLPDDDERKTVQEFLQAEPEQRAVRVGHLVWSLVASAEFALNH